MLFKNSYGVINFNNMLVIRNVLFFSLFIFSNFSAFANSYQSYFDFNDVEKRYLERFFQAFFLDDDFSYTLFGAKPMSFSGIYKKNSDSLEPVSSLIPAQKNISLWNAVEFFKKHRKNVNKHYFFVFNEDENGILIYFIDRENFVKTINNNIDIFLKELGENFTVADFLQEVLEEQVSFLDAIHHHEGILGILLGYGRHNSMLFQRKADILGRCWAYGDNMISRCPTFSDTTFRDEELLYLEKKLDSFSEENEYSLLMPVSPLGFASDNDHIETKKLKSHYSFIRKLINETYIRSDPTDIILDMLF